jgi:RNA polymerase sigma-70 factor (ECF subfamily)
MPVKVPTESLVPNVDDDFAKIFDESKPELINAVSKRIGLELGQRVSPSDVLQEAFIRAQQKLDKYLEDPEVPMIVFLRGICVQVISIFYRKHFVAAKRSVSKERFQDETEYISIEQQVDSGPSPSGCLIKEEERRFVVEMINSLPENDRVILTLRHVDMLSNQDAAEYLRLSESATKKRHARAMKRLTRLAEEQMLSMS